MNNHFEKNNVLVFKLKSLFDFITSTEVKTEEECFDFIEKMKEDTMEEPDTHKDKQMFLLYRVPTSLMNMSLDMIEEKLSQMKEDMDSEIFWRFLGLEGLPKPGELDGTDSDEEDDEEEEEKVRDGEMEVIEERGEKKLSRKELDNPFRGMDKADRKKQVRE